MLHGLESSRSLNTPMAQNKPDQRSLRHIDDAADAISSLVGTMTSSVPLTQVGGCSRYTHMHIMESFVDVVKSAMVRHILVDLDGAFEVV